MVVNLDTTIAVTQNYCSISNLHRVWPKTVKGRPKLSTHWWRALKTERPELIPIIEEINRTVNLETNSNDSSDSSSSSSSSSSTSNLDSSDEALENNKKEAIKRYKYKKELFKKILF